MQFWANVLLYQATWFAAIIGAADGLWWPGPLMAIAFAAWQLHETRFRAADLRLVAALVLVGFAADSAFAQSGIVEYAASEPWPHMAPAWIVAIWGAFALTINHSLASLQTRPLIGAVLGAVGAPLAYLAAARGWHAITLTSSALLAIGAFWAVLTPSALLWARHLRAAEVATVRNPS